MLVLASSVTLDWNETISFAFFTLASFLHFFKGKNRVATAIYCLDDTLEEEDVSTIFDELAQLLKSHSCEKDFSPKFRCQQVSQLRYMSRTNTYVLYEQAEKLVLIFVLVLGSKAPSNDDRGHQKFEYLTRENNDFCISFTLRAAFFNLKYIFFLCRPLQPRESPVEGAKTRSEKLLYFFF